MSRALPVHGVEADASAQDNAPLILAARVHDLLEWEPFIRDAARVTELHAMRIAAKRLRYTVEVFAPLMGDTARDALERFKEVQELLGGIHDLDIIAPIIGRKARRALQPARRAETWLSTDCSGALGLVQVCRRMHARRRALHRQLLAEWRRLRRDHILEMLAAAEFKTARKQQSGMDMELALDP